MNNENHNINDDKSNENPKQDNIEHMLLLLELLEKEVDVIIKKGRKTK